MGVSGGKPARIPSADFTAFPNAVARAVEGSLLDYIDVTILVALFFRADRESWTVRISLIRLVEAVAWKRTEDALYRRLVDLRDEGWIDYEVRPGSKKAVYRISLKWRPERSEFGPSTSRLDAPSTRRAESRPAGAVAPRESADRSEHEEAPHGLDGPSDPAAGPSTKADARPFAEPNRAHAPDAPVRARSDLPREKTHRGSEEEDLGLATGRRPVEDAEPVEDIVASTEKLLSALGFGAQPGSAEPERADDLLADLPASERGFMRELVETFDAAAVEDEGTP